MSVESSALNVERSAPRGAVFLSYASQDAEAVARIAEALRAAGVEVWFDRDELVGGDQWDQKIRNQIKACTLFVPVISAATQARLEGYFRLEWKLAANRTHTMAEEKAFLLPVVIDDTSDVEAKVPAEFKAVQWTRLPVTGLSGLVARMNGLLMSRRPASGSRPVMVVPPGWVGPVVTVTAKSVAVLAFANLSSDRDNEYFSDGISEELLNVLARVAHLKVTARTSAFHFKGKDTPIPEIARQLGVAYVVEGSVRKMGNRVRITAQLINAADGFHLWSENFDREVQDIFAVQDEIAGLIAKNLQLTLQTKSRPRSVNPDAYELLLKGRAFFRRGVPADYPLGIQYVNDSLAIDPDSSAAWGALALGYIVAFAQAVHGWLPREEVLRLARQAADRATELDSEQPLGHRAQCLIAYLADWDWAQADASMQRVLALTPGDSESPGIVAGLDLTAGRVAHALEQARRAVLLDPLNFISAYQLMKALWHSGDYSGMENEAKRLIAIHPGSPYGYTFLSYSLLLRGRAAEAVRAAESVPSDAYRLTSLALAHHAQGKSAAADAALAELAERFAATGAYQVAEVYAFRNDMDRAFDWLEAAYRERDSGLTLITNDPFFANVRGDARWTAFMKKMNLPAGDPK